MDGSPSSKYAHQCRSIALHSNDLLDALIALHGTFHVAQRNKKHSIRSMVSEVFTRTALYWPFLRHMLHLLFTSPMKTHAFDMNSSASLLFVLVKAMPTGGKEDRL